MADFLHRLSKPKPVCMPFFAAREVNSITPGHPVHTSMSETTYGEAQRKIWKDPAEIAPAFVHLALQDSSGIHDQYVRAWDLACKIKAESAA